MPLFIDVKEKERVNTYIFRSQLNSGRLGEAKSTIVKLNPWFYKSISRSLITLLNILYDLLFLICVGTLSVYCQIYLFNYLFIIWYVSVSTFVTSLLHSNRHTAAYEVKHEAVLLNYICALFDYNLPGYGNNYFSFIIFELFHLMRYFTLNGHL